MTEQVIKDILRDPNEKSRNLRLAQYLNDNKLTPDEKVVVSAAGDTVEVVLTLIGLSGAVRVLRFVFNNKDSLYKVYFLLKSFFNKNGNAGVLFVDAVRFVFLNLNSTLGVLVSKGAAITLKVIRDNVFG